jgi:hypothetical protein
VFAHCFGRFATRHLGGIKMENILSELITYSPLENVKKIRFGTRKDGGYILLNKNLDKANFLYSYGVANEYTFDYDFCHEFKIPGRLFDPTVDHPSKLSDFLYFYKRGLACGDGSISEHLCQFSDANGRGILKIDIEGCEWHWLKNLNYNEVNRFDQIIIEFHDLHNTEKQEFYAECLKKINNNFYLVHVHANNFFQIEKVRDYFLPPLLECTYIAKSLCECEVNTKTKYPIDELDFPCIPDKAEIELNFYPFISWTDYRKEKNNLLKAEQLSEIPELKRKSEILSINLNNLALENISLKNRISSMESSLSWKISKPFRLVDNFYKKFLKK